MTDDDALRARLSRRLLRIVASAAALVSLALLAVWVVQEPSRAGSEPIVLSGDPAAALADDADAPTERDVAVAPTGVDTPAADGDAPPGARGPLGAERDAPAPVRLRIPALQLDTTIVPLGLNDDGSLEVPAGAHVTGWWTAGPEPGEASAAVITGHVDSHDGPGVFFLLHQLEAGELVHVDRVDGSTTTWVVRSTEQHAKEYFPTRRVYARSPRPLLRLVTCGGGFNWTQRSYSDNVIVFAEFADPAEADTGPPIPR